MIKADLIITNGTVVTVNPASDIIEHGAIAVSDTRILDIDHTENLLAHYQSDLIVDATDHLVIPGLINAHTHTPMTLFRGLRDDTPLIPWLEAMSVAANKVINSAVVRTAAQLGYVEQLLGGITTTLDMYFYPEMLVEAARAAGIRLITGPVFVASNQRNGLSGVERIELDRRFILGLRDDPLIVPCVAPHSTLDVSPQILQQAADLASEFNVHLHLHTSETKEEINSLKERYGLTPVELLAELSLLSRKTVLAHCVHVSEHDIELIAENGSTVVHCPVSNLKLADGIAPVPGMLEAGANLALGTDGPGSSNDLNMWLVLRLAAILHKGSHLDPELLPAEKVFRLSTIEAAQALGLDDKIGSLEIGKAADLVLIRLDQPHLVPLYNIFSHLVYAVGREDVSTVIVNGEIIVNQRTFEKLDVHMLMEEVRQIANRIKDE